MNDNNIVQQKENIALEILNIARNTLLVNMRFLSTVFTRLQCSPYSGTLATNAETIFFDADYVINLYKQGKEETVRAYLHTLLHCIFRHPFVNKVVVEPRLWNLACDVAVEAIIGEWNLPCANVALRRERNRSAESIKERSKFLTAEKIYFYLRESNVSEQTLARWEKLFCCDDHTLWFESSSISGGNERNKSDSNNLTTENNKTHGDQDDGNDEQNGECDEQRNNSDSPSSSNRDELENMWKDLAERLQTDLEMFSKEWGDASGSMVMALREVNRERYDYATFLNKFAVLNEAMKINDDEFDYVFYTYGLRTYGNVPLVEPLEYKDVKQIREFVIAIDTSGSVKGHLVQSFIRKTYNILKQQENFARKINVHIVQCDHKIQNDTKITNLQELEQYFTNLKLYGFGGTDFRPVFSYVDQLIAQKELTNLRGLIYFTDGYGTFPERKPPYNTAFVFVDDNYNNYDVPSWAIKLILETKDI